MILQIDFSKHHVVYQKDGKIAIEIDPYKEMPALAAYVTTYDVDAYTYRLSVAGKRRKEKRLTVGANGGIFLESMG